MHTPGPWTTVRDNFISRRLLSESGATCRIIFGDVDVAYCPPTDGDGGNENARLIAAAPNVVEASERLIAILSPFLAGLGELCPMRIKIELLALKAAIHDARG